MSAAPGVRARVARRPFAAELGLLALGLGTAASFNRLFVGWAFLGSLLPAVVIGWGLAVLLRRAGVGVAGSLVLHLIAGLVLVTVQFAPGTHLLGVPTPDTARSLARAVESSFAEFSELVAPVPARDGFLVVVAAGLWVFAYFLDTAAARFRGNVQGAVPHTAVFVTVGVLARSSGRVLAVVLFGLGVAAYAVSRVRQVAGEQRWIDHHTRRGVRAFTGRAAAGTAVALVVGVAVAPFVPTSEPPVDLRSLGRGDGPRTVVSPFVGLRSLLGQRSDEVVFTVEADAPAYWRLTALEQFDADRHIWVSSGSYAAAQGPLEPGDASMVPGSTLRQEIEVIGLGGLWLPGAYVPSRIESERPVSYDRDSSSIIRRDPDDRGRLSYTLESLVPDFGVLRRRGTPSSNHSAGIDRVHLELPDLPTEVTDALAQATAGEVDDHARLLALQDWFRSRFSYDESVDYSADADPLTAFLEQRRGFCQQFSSAFALMARALGYPSRVAVGFTPGEATRPEGGTASTRFVVRGRHAHAWPEVHLAGVGWVPFEPTPQRGNPQAVEHTGVAPQQAPPPSGSGETTTTLAGGDEPSVTTAPQRPTATVAPAAAGDRPGSDSSERGVPGGVVAAVVALVGVLVVVGVLLRRRRARGRAADDVARAEVAGAWQRALRAVQRSGLRPRDAETPVEFSARAAAALGEVSPRLPGGERSGLGEAVAALADLAVLETRARYAPGSPPEEDRRAASEAAEAVTARSDALRAARPLLQSGSGVVVGTAQAVPGP